MKINLFLILFIAYTSLGYSQPYVDGGNTRHRFAQMTLGLEQRFFPGDNTSFSSETANGLIHQEAMPDLFSSRIIIGGTHFWGHADFYVSFPVLNSKSAMFRDGVETGAKYYPWRIESGKFTPFLGASWQVNAYQQGDGVLKKQSSFPLLAGLTFTHNSLLFDLNAGYIFNNSMEYYINRNTVRTIQAHPCWISAGLRFFFDTTLPAEKDWLSGRTHFLTDTLGKLNRLNGFTVALGLSSTNFLLNSTYNDAKRPYLGKVRSGKIFPEFSVGYYLHNPDLQFKLVYRNVKAELQAYGIEQQIGRRSLTLEAYRFTFDFHGFVPFIGPAISAEWLSVSETEYGLETGIYTNRHIRPGIVFGWDIRPNRLQNWYIRTNLRYIPGLKVEMPEGLDYRLDQLEFNFFQLVVFPGRFR